MNMIKIAMTATASLGLVLAGTAANAEQVRSSAATPGVVSVKKAKLARTTAPAARESRAVEGTDIVIGVVAAAGAGFAAYEITKSDDSPGS
jgi:hypothetical protein